MKTEEKYLPLKGKHIHCIVMKMNKTHSEVTNNNFNSRETLTIQFSSNAINNRWSDILNQISVYIFTLCSIKSVWHTDLIRIYDW